MRLSKYLFITFLLTIILIAGCTTSSARRNINNTHWSEIELKDVAKSEKFKISELKGGKILLETFSVYCSNCKDQQDELKIVNGENNLTIISLSTDPREDEETIKKHILENNYTWIYSIASPQMTESLMKEFGFIITQSAQAPIVLICEDGSYSLLPTGIKNSDKLKEEIELGC